MNHKKIKASLLSAFILFSFACSNAPDKPEYTDSPTMGDVMIVSDESYEPLMKVEIDTFMKIYKYATIRATYLPEAETFDQLLHNDSIRLAVVSRPLNEEEKAYFDGRKIIPRVTKIAVDAVALVINRSNADTALLFSQLRDIISGKAQTWNQVDKAGLRDSIRIVFDRNGSSNTRFLQERLLGKNPLPANCFATNSNASVIEYVEQHPGAIGVISVNWISDRKDPEVESFLNKVHVVELSAEEDKAGIEYFGPYQAYIALKKYPLIREVLMISREGRNGLGTGFASFVAGDQGQRLIRRSGLLPATMPVRIVNIKQ